LGVDFLIQPSSSDSIDDRTVMTTPKIMAGTLAQKKSFVVQEKAQARSFVSCLLGSLQKKHAARNYHFAGWPVR
jgi:hypothetical protein